ncbi:hypothetical protein Tco_0311399 [Tanacetum coccineum]
MTTLSPSPPISLSPPSAGECLARCTAPPAHSSPQPVPSPLLPSSGCPTQFQTLRIASTQALIDAVTAALPSPPLPPPLYIPPPVDRRDDIPESEQPPHNRLCLSILSSRYKIGESSTDRPNGGRGIDYGFVSTVDAEERRQGIRDVGYGIRDTWIDLTEVVPEVAPMTVGEAEIAALRKSDRRRQAQMAETLRVIRDMRREMSDMQAELLAHQEHQGRARRPRPDARIPDHWDASGDADSHVYGCAVENQVKFATCTLLGAALTWWNGQIRTLGPEAYAMTWEVLKKKMTDKDIVAIGVNSKKLEIELSEPEGLKEMLFQHTLFVDKYISGLPNNIYGNVKSARPKTLDETIELANDLMDQKLRTYAEKGSEGKDN